MGGYGSSRWHHTATKQHTGACLCLDLSRLRPYLVPGVRYAMPWRWTLTGGQVYRIGIAVERERISLDYTTQRGSAPPHAIHETVEVEWVACPYGGARPWYRCPGCDRRRGALFLPPDCDRFRCRQCHALAYPSQQVAPHARHLIAMRTIQRRLGAEGTDLSATWVPAKPTGMHWRTYERLRAEHERHEEEREAILLEEMRRLLARIERTPPHARRAPRSALSGEMCEAMLPARG